MFEMGQQLHTAIQSETAAMQQAEALKFPNRKVPKVRFENPFAGQTFTPTREMLHPPKVRQTCEGMGGGGGLLWGEQFAPTRLSWKIMESTNWAAAADWSVNSHAMTDLGASWQIRSDDWNNNFPV